jgi:hypothetical protein
VIAVGINALREMIVRTPAVLHEPDMDGFVQVRRSCGGASSVAA